MSLENSIFKNKNIIIDGPRGPLELILHVPQVGDNDYVLILCHGFRGSKDGGGRAVLLADKAAAMGFWVVRFDFTPQVSLSRQVEEVAAVVKYCRSFLTEQVVLLGRSMGGCAALAFAAKDQKVDGLCLWATPWDLQSTFKIALASGYEKLKAGEELALQDEYGCITLTPEFITDFDNFDLVKSVKSVAGIPLLVVHGNEDTVVPVIQAKELFAQAKPPKDLVIIPKGDHQFLASHQVASGAVLTWLARMFTDKGI